MRDEGIISYLLWCLAVSDSILLLSMIAGRFNDLLYPFRYSPAVKYYYDGVFAYVRVYSLPFASFGQTCSIWFEVLIAFYPDSRFKIQISLLDTWLQFVHDTLDKIKITVE